MSWRQRGFRRHAPAAFLVRKNHGTICTGDWVGPTAFLDGCGEYKNILLPLGFEL